MNPIAFVAALAATQIPGGSVSNSADRQDLEVKQVKGPVPIRAAFPVQFAQSLNGRTVRVMLDGRTVKTTTAGKLYFRDAQGAGVSVCADVRAPVARGMSYPVTPFRTLSYGGNISKAGNIVSKWFRNAQSADECAGLQLAVWEAIEDGGERADFGSGRFRAEASLAVLAYAQRVYPSISEAGDALYLQAGQGGLGASGGGRGSGQSQITTAL